MNEDVRTVEMNIDDLGPSGFFEKHDVLFKVADLDEVPYTSFEELQKDLHNGQAIARISPYGAGYSSGTFSLFASPLQRRLLSMILLSSYIAAAIGIGLAVFADGWWWLLLLFAPLVAMKRGKKIYTEALFKAIEASEKAFCFAFCGNVIILETADGKIRARGMEPL